MHNFILILTNGSFICQIEIELIFYEPSRAELMSGLTHLTDIFMVDSLAIALVYVVLFFFFFFLLNGDILSAIESSDDGRVYYDEVDSFRE